MQPDVIKGIHILSATILFGTGLGTAFFKWSGDRQSDTTAINQINRFVVKADWIFTTPAIVLQAITGTWLVHVTGYSIHEPWIMMSMGLFILAGSCWLPVVYLQIRMCQLSGQAVAQRQSLSQGYYRLTRFWFWLGVLAFLSVMMIIFLMVVKPVISM